MTTFPDAPDFNEGSQPWRRAAEEVITSLSTDVAILTKNLRAYQRSTVAGTKATNLKISGLSGTHIPPETPINISVYPYAYFNSSGYPAAGAHVYWGDQNDADHYEIWVRRIDSAEAGILADTQQATVTQIASADVRGLEVKTDYELMIRAISYGGTYGFFTASVPFTTPDELTMIGPYGYPEVSYKNGFGIIEWARDEWATPPSTDYTVDQTMGGIGGLLDRNSPGRGVQAGNAIFYPPGTQFGYSGQGNILYLNTGATLSTNYGLPLGAESEGVGEGALGDNGHIYWSRSTGYTGGETEIIDLVPGSASASLISLGVLPGRFWLSLVKAGNGRIYGAPTEEQGFLVITASGVISEDSLSFTVAPGDRYGMGAADASGNVWFAPEGSADHFLHIDVSDFAPVVSRVPIDPAGWTADPGTSSIVLHPNGSVYAFKTTGAVAWWYRISPDGSHTFGTDSGGNRFSSYPVIGADGRIYTFYRTSGGANTFSAFDPETETYERYWWQPATGTFFNAVSVTGATDGNIYIRCVEQVITEPSNNYPTDRFMVISPHRTDIPGIPAPDGGATPSYFKHMLVERRIIAGGGGEVEDAWLTIGAMPAEGYFMDPTVEAGGEYEYRFAPVSTAGTIGNPSGSAELSVPTP